MNVLRDENRADAISTENHHCGGVWTGAEQWYRRQQRSTEFGWLPSEMYVVHTSASTHYMETRDACDIMRCVSAD